MNIMQALDAKASTNSPRKTEKKSLSQGTGKKILKEKPVVSAEEIRAKMKAQNEPAAKTQLSSVKSKSPSFAMSDDIEEIERRSAEAKKALAEKKQMEEAQELESPVSSDVGKNSPNDPATLGKLKDVLSKGAFKFSEKEREALSKILN